MSGGKSAALRRKALEEARGGPRREIVIACGSSRVADAWHRDLRREADVVRIDRRGREVELANGSHLVVLGGDEMQRVRAAR